MNFKNPEGQIARWLEILGTYNFKIKHRAGRIHSNADALSRRPCLTSDCTYCFRAENNYERTETAENLADCEKCEHNFVKESPQIENNAGIVNTCIKSIVESDCNFTACCSSCEEPIRQKARKVRKHTSGKVLETSAA